VASGQDIPGAVTFHTDATIYRCQLAMGKEVIHDCAEGRCVFLYLTEGSLSVNGQEVAARDQVRFKTAEHLVIKAQELSDFMLIDVPARTE
jgi:redox-sensitive bicupin YhaK (pirin superfamily)